MKTVPIVSSLRERANNMCDEIEGWNARVQIDVAATEHGVSVAVRDVRVRMHRKVKEGELADCNGTSGHRGAR